MHRPGFFGPVPSNATASFFFERAMANPELFGHGIERLTRELRADEEELQRTCAIRAQFKEGGV